MYSYKIETFAIKLFFLHCFSCSRSDIIKLQTLWEEVRYLKKEIILKLMYIHFLELLSQKMADNLSNYTI